MSSNVVSFVEESCFSGETFRSVRREVVFTVQGYGNRLGQACKVDLVADNGIWYDHEDTYLLALLQTQAPGIDWGSFVFHKKMDHSAIEIIDTDTDEVVGSIHVRRGTKLSLAPETVCATVVNMAQWKESRNERQRLEEYDRSNADESPADGTN